MPPPTHTHRDSPVGLAGKCGNGWIDPDAGYGPPPPPECVVRWPPTLEGGSVPAAVPISSTLSLPGVGGFGVMSWTRVAGAVALEQQAVRRRDPGTCDTQHAIPRSKYRLP